MIPRSMSPTKDDLKPNPHPYAIKTTSTALLSRSNSNSSQNKHHYIPSPSPSPTHRSTPRIHGHRYSRSLTSEPPRPLPAPPTGSPAGKKRAETVDTIIDTGRDVDLPPNPKLWTPTQLSAYLSTALRVKSGEALQLPTPVANDIAAFVKQSRITGKAFLRFGESDFAQFGINKLWCSALVAASRTLRQNVLKGQIWGFGSPPGDAESDGEDGSHPFYKTAVYSSASSASSSSSVDGLPHSYSETDLNHIRNSTPTRNPVITSIQTHQSSLGRYKSGRVKGMVESFERVRERSDSESSFSEDDDNHRGRLRTISHSPEREMYQTIIPGSAHRESDTYSETEVYETASSTHPEGDPISQSTSPHASRGDHYDEEPTMEELLASSEIDPSMTGSAYATGSSLSNSGIMVSGTTSAYSSGRNRRKGGVHAWEDDDGVLGVTVKRIPQPGDTDGSGRPLPPIPSGTPGSPSEDVPLIDNQVGGSVHGSDGEGAGSLGASWGAIDMHDTHSPGEGTRSGSWGEISATGSGGGQSGKGSRISAKGKGKAKRIGVGEIFGSGSDDIGRARHVDASVQPEGEVGDGTSSVSTTQYQSLERELIESKALLGDYVRRLADVEKTVERLEQNLAAREGSEVERRVSSSNSSYTALFNSFARAILGRFWMGLGMGQHLRASAREQASKDSSGGDVELDTIQTEETRSASPSRARDQQRIVPSTLVAMFRSINVLKWNLLALPKYVILFGIGVCATVLRVVIGRATRPVGRNIGGRWR